ncbi:hypothetical protein STRTUCAR8_06191 [Streptomyces turgidiscabies Car8]|uniref:Uncharacterized protein n=1 Tax=Streptomyces turgidiscabies (strain Car8) TaxID=698760 RepID=L7F6J0_STRT8|nr:hypothetical protein STRTUCAR8_06191 [Streptomyces turgidiscabies Car8]
MLGCVLGAAAWAKGPCGGVCGAPVQSVCERVVTDGAQLVATIGELVSEFEVFRLGPHKPSTFRRALGRSLSVAGCMLGS